MTTTETDDIFAANNVCGASPTPSQEARMFDGFSIGSISFNNLESPVHDSNYQSSSAPALHPSTMGSLATEPTFSTRTSRENGMKHCAPHLQISLPPSDGPPRSEPKPPLTKVNTHDHSSDEDLDNFGAFDGVASSPPAFDAPPDLSRMGRQTDSAIRINRSQHDIMQLLEDGDPAVDDDDDGSADTGEGIMHQKTVDCNDDEIMSDGSPTQDFDMLENNHLVHPALQSHHVNPTSTSPSHPHRPADLESIPHSFEQIHDPVIN